MNKFRIVFATIAVAVMVFAVDTVVTNGVTYTRRGALDTRSDMVVTAVDADRFATTNHVGDVTARLATNERRTDILYLNASGSNAWFIVEHYFGMLGLPSLSLWEIRDGEQRKVWDEKTMHADTYSNAVAAAATLCESVIEMMPSRAWGDYTSTGQAAPDTNMVYISHGTMVHAGAGHEWRRFEFVGGGVSVYCSDNGSTGVDKNGQYYVADSSGKRLLETCANSNIVVKPMLSQISVQKNSIAITVPKKVQGIDIPRPTLIWSDTVAGLYTRVPESLSEPNTNNCPWVATWDGESDPNAGAYMVVAQGRANTPRAGFFKVIIPESGGEELRVNVPLNPKAGILCTDGKHRVVPVYNETSGEITWTLAQ